VEWIRYYQCDLKVRSLLIFSRSVPMMAEENIANFIMGLRKVKHFAHSVFLISVENNHPGDMWTFERVFMLKEFGDVHLMDGVTTTKEKRNAYMEEFVSRVNHGSISFFPSVPLKDKLRSQMEACTWEPKTAKGVVTTRWTCGGTRDDLLITMATNTYILMMIVSRKITVPDRIWFK